MTRMLMALAFAALTSSCATAAPPAASDFEGDWVYREQCGWRQITIVEIAQTGGVITGSWSDGERRRGRGEDGRLEGRINGDRLEVRLCRSYAPGQDDECPSFGPWSDHFALRDDALEWYQPFGERGHLLYVTLQRADSLPAEQPDAECPQDFD